jgi:hypothetical protein
MNDKIKHLLATAYKTDSIEKNKWRIENREQRREQRKKELAELMEKDKQNHIGDTNEMRGAVDILFNKFLELFLFQEGIPDELEEAYKQAKEMQKQQHGKTWDDAMENMKARGGNDMRAYTDFDNYYEEKFGGNDE